MCEETQECYLLYLLHSHCGQYFSFQSFQNYFQSPELFDQVLGVTFFEWNFLCLLTPGIEAEITRPDLFVF